MTSPRPPLAVRVYRILLRAYPPAFRRAFGDDMVQLFDDKRRAARGRGMRARLACGARALRDLLVHALQERMASSSRRPLPEPSGTGTRVPTPQSRIRGAADALGQDVRFAARLLRRAPGFALIAVLTLALGIGANTAIFSVINGVLFRPLRFGEPEQLVVITEQHPTQVAESDAASMGVFLDWRAGNRTLTDLTLWGSSRFVLDEDDPSWLDGVIVYPNFFEVLRLPPLFGRPFTMEDAAVGRQGSVVVISHRLWRDRWGGDPAVVGRVIRLDGRPVEIIGVMRPNIAAPLPEVDLWLPVNFTAPNRWTRHARWLTAVGRVRPGVTLAQTRDDFLRISNELQAGEFSDIYEGWQAEVEPMRERIVGEARATLVVAFVAVGLVLLIACVNIANMLLARAAVREREIAVRAALGAGRARLTRQLLTESVMLSVGAGAVGVVFAKLTHNLILAFEPGVIPRAEELALDGAALGFAVLASVATGVLFGLAPALHGARVDLQETLTESGSRSATAGRRHNRMRAVLVISQLALTTMLLCGAGLLMRTMLELQKVDPGFDPDRAVAARVFLNRASYDTSEKVRQYGRDLRAALAALPGVEQVGGTSALPMDPFGVNYDLPYRLEGQEHLEDDELPQADYRVVTPGYFAAMGVPVLHGRGFTEFDGPDAPRVALVNQTMANEVWPGRSPVGERLYTPAWDWEWFEVIGVVSDTRYYGLGTEPRGEMYMAHAQFPDEMMTFVVRSATHDALSLTALVRRGIADLDRSQPAHSVVTMASLIGESIAVERFYALVLAIFAFVAFALSGAGVYGVLSYWVNQRRHDIGVRMALGATANGVWRLVVGRGMTYAALGIGVGLLGALASSRVLANVVYGVGTADPATFGGVAVLLGATALLACWLPARRATRLDPIQPLRNG